MTETRIVLKKAKAVKFSKRAIQLRGNSSFRHNEAVFLINLAQ